MGCNAREKPLRGGRKSRHASKSHAAPDAAGKIGGSSLSLPSPVPGGVYPTPILSDGYDDESGASWGYCSEDQLEEILLGNLESVYNQALKHLVSLGYDESLALRAVLRNGHCYGSMDVLSNILHNAVAYLNSAPPLAAADSALPEAAAFSDLRHLEEYSLAGMVCLLQQVRPALSRGDALWCLLMADLHVGRASAVEIPPAPDLTGLHRLSSAAEASRHLDLPRSIRPPSLHKPYAAHRRSLPPSPVAADSDVVADVLKSLENMTITEESDADEKEDGCAPPDDDHKKEIILDLVRQIRELEGQVRERKEWAQQKAMQAARKLSNDLAELKALRIERDENQRVKKGKQPQEDPKVKRLAELDAALRRISGQVDRSNGEVRRLEMENAEIRAEMEASKLSAAESVTASLEVAKREKRCLKRLLAWEKQREKLQEEVAGQRRKIAELQQQLVEIKEAQKQTEVNWKQEIRAKERAIGKLEEERRAKEAAEATIRRKHEALQQKIELDFQRHKDDIQRLEDELARLKASSELNTSSKADTDGTKSQKEANAKTNRGLNPQELSENLNNRGCVICMKDEVSVVFLPCAHQVVCASCNEEHSKRPKSFCPCCNVRIEQRIRVYGASS